MINLINKITLHLLLNNQKRFFIVGRYYEMRLKYNLNILQTVLKNKFNIYSLLSRQIKP